MLVPISWGRPGRHQVLLLANPAVVGELTQFASRQAVSQGHRAGTAEHEQAAQRLFYENLTHLREQAQANSPKPAEPETMQPKFFEPPSSPAPSNQASMYSAPVSRAGGFQQSSRVTLTREDKEYARIAGITEVEYAKQKQKLAEMKANGEYGERR
jgi:hypothetical protein